MLHADSDGEHENDSEYLKDKLTCCYCKKYLLIALSTESKLCRSHLRVT